MKIGVLDSLSGTYRNLMSGDTYWKTRYNDATRRSSTPRPNWATPEKSFVTNTLAIDLDTTFTNAPITTASEFPSGADNLHNKLSVYYGRRQPDHL